MDRVFNVVNEHSRQPVENPALRAIREGLVVGLANHTVLIAKDNTEIPIDDSGAPADLRQVVEAGIDAVGPAALARSIEIKSNFDPETGLVLGDPDRLQQIVWNLLSNAVKFTPKDGKIRVTVARNGSNLQIIVKDTGVGIRKEFLPQVFDRFAQADTSSSRKYGGLGLGLAITRHLIELHGGAVTAESPGEGQGSTFVVTLPEKAGVLSESKTKRPADLPGASLGAKNRLDGAKILVVDDDAEARELLTTMLAQEGAEVKPCERAAQAIELVKEWRPVVLVSDIGMPDEDGYSLIRRLRALDPLEGGKTPALALTGFARNEDRMRALQAGFDMYIPKPLEPVGLVSIIASMVGRTRK